MPREPDQIVRIAASGEEADAVVSVVGDQVISATPSDVGKVVTVASDGTLTLAAGGGGGVTDHGALSGLGDNDHSAVYVPLAGGTSTGEQVVPDLKVTGITGSVSASRYVGATTSGAPTTGAHLLGDWVIDLTGKVWICTTAGTPGTWAQVGASAGVWSPLATPASPHASDDEFNDGSVAGAWTTLNPNSLLTLTEADYGLQMAFSGSAGADNLHGVHKAAPAGDFAVWSKVNFLGPRGNYTKAGLFIAQDLVGAPSTADLWGNYLSFDATSAVATRSFWTSATAQSSTGAGSVNLDVASLWLRLRLISGTVFYDYSLDGLGWKTAFGSDGSVASIARVGLFVAPWAATTVVFSFVRFSALTAAGVVPPGRRI